MEVFKQYDVFKENCFSFAARFEKKYFETAGLVCHPTTENEIITPCSAEESKSNGLNICRFSDMMLMSEDCENWKSFSLAGARSIAADKGYVYLTDLLFEGAFYAEDWMINGKNDTIVVSEEYMREKGKKYAPVTPLTNRVLHFKKFFNEFFWKTSSPDKLLVLDSDGIKSCLENYCDAYSANIPSLSASDDITFPLFDTKVTINTATSRALKIDLFFTQIDKAVKEFGSAEEILTMADYKFSSADFIGKLFEEALEKNGIKLSSEEFIKKFAEPIRKLSDADFEKKIECINVKSGSRSIDEYKSAFIDALKSDSSLGIVYPAGTTTEYSDKLREIEQADFDGIIGTGEEKYMITSLLSHMPTDFIIFAYIISRYPEETNNAMRIADFWGIEPVNEEELQNLIFRNYLSNDLFDDKGNFAAGFEHAVIIRDQLHKVSDKYSFATPGFISDLDTYIHDIDLKRRSYNGTVFDTPEDMKRAMANELELQALCIDLGALDESELVDLRKHINGLTTDEATKAKYLVKVKIAMNRVEESVLAQKCLGLAMLDVDETIKLKNEIEKADYAESVVKPVIADVKDRLLTAEKEELEKLTGKMADMKDTELSQLCEVIGSDRYDEALRKTFIKKVADFKENRIKTDIEKICKGMEDFTLQQINEAKSKLKNSGYGEKYIFGMLAELDKLAADYQKREAAKLFENISIATAEQLADIKKKLDEAKYPQSVLEPYEGMIEAREKALLDDEINSLCGGIDQLDEEKLTKLKADINNPEKKYDPELVAKYNEDIARRSCELKNSELAERCKYIFSMEQDKLNEIKEVLLSGKYDEDISTLYLKKVTERETELRREELAKMCENIGSAETEALEKLKADIVADEKYIGICDEFIAKINARLSEIKLAEFNKKLESVNEMDNEALDKFRAEMSEQQSEIGEELYNQAIAKADERANNIELAKLDEIISGIDEFTVEQCENASAIISAGEFKPENAEKYTDLLDERVENIYLSMLDEAIAGFENMDKEQLTAASQKVAALDCPSELKQPYIYKLDKAVEELAEKEIRKLCGDIGSLSIRKATDIKLKINVMSAEPVLKNQYLDALDAHIMALEESEQKEYLAFLSEKMQEFDVPKIAFLVPDVSNLFYTKYDEACKSYVSAGRFELPLFMHEVDSKNGFTLTTDFLYVFTNGQLTRIKIEDIASFQTKKALISSSITVTERSAHSSELPSGGFDKKALEPTSKAMTALVSYINEKRSAEHMKELEIAAQEKAREAIEKEAAAAAKLAAEKAAEEARLAAEAKAAEEAKIAAEKSAAEAKAVENGAEEAKTDDEKTSEKPDENKTTTSEVKPAEEEARFCDQCGAKIVNPKAKFCAECGNKLK